MKTRNVVLWSAVCGGIGVLVAGRVLAGAGPAVAACASLTVVASGDDASPYAYVGSKTCKKCHIKVYKSWAKTKMGMAFNTLKPGEVRETKVKFHVDADKDFTQDPKCLKCHTVGFGKKGGYAVPDPSDKKAVRTAKKLQGVGCEACHGPGSEYVKVFKEIQKSKRTYNVEELFAVGLQKIEESTCLVCHNEESPTINPGDPFDFEKRKDQGTHEHAPLKQRVH